MNYEVSEKKGGSLSIGLTETGEGQFEVTIDGKSVHVDAVRSGPTIYSIIENGRQFEAMVDEKGAHGFDVLVGGRIFHLESIDERTKLLAGSAHAVATGPETIEAEMPGKVVKINVEAGASVAEGEGVLVIEAMKMENEIPAPFEGVVSEIDVAEGDTVEAGTPLFTVVPPSEDENA
jgi:biotin carboxyl carrier protein